MLPNSAQLKLVFYFKLSSFTICIVEMRGVTKRNSISGTMSQIITEIFKIRKFWQWLTPSGREPNKHNSGYAANSKPSFLHVHRHNATVISLAGGIPFLVSVSNIVSSLMSCWSLEQIFVPSESQHWSCVGWDQNHCMINIDNLKNMLRK